MQPEYAMNRKKTTMLYNCDTVIMQKNIFFGQRNFLHVIIAMLHYLCYKRNAF